MIQTDIKSVTAKATAIRQPLRTATLQLPENRRVFPFNLPAFRKTKVVDFHSNVTFLVGENGSGKSTFLEAIAELAKLPMQGGSNNFARSEQTSELAKHIVLVRGSRHPKTSFFLRAESFFNVATTVEELKKAPGPPLTSFGETSLHEQSHGESFLALLEHRFWPSGLYLMDEPEAALSPQRQLAFLAYLHRFVGEDSQFVIATHSPILLAYPNSRIYYFGPDGIEPIAYEQTEHKSLTLDFLQNRQRYLERILRPT